MRDDATDGEKIERILAADPWLARLTADDSPLGIMVELTQRESISQGEKDASANCAAHWRDLRRQLALRSLPSGDGRRLHAEVLRVLEKLIPEDPSPDSTEGQILVALATAVETYEKSSTASETAIPEWIEFEKAKPAPDARVRIRLFSGTEVDARYHDGDFQTECMSVNQWVTGHKVFAWRPQ